VDGLLAPYLEGVLPRAQARAVEEHLRECPTCRAARAEVERGLILVSRLPIVSLDPEPALRLREAVDGALGWRRHLRLAVAALLAAGASGAVAYGLLRPRLQLVAVNGAPTPFEQLALDLHEHGGTGRGAGSLPTSSVVEARDWARSRARLDQSLAATRPPEDGDRYRLEGIATVPFEGATAVVVSYRIDGLPVTLLTARARDVAARSPEWTLRGKTVRSLRRGERKALAWTNSGQAYVLVSALPEHGQQSCLVCHTTPGRRRLIAGLPHS
jgi:hypothetical protein